MDKRYEDYAYVLDFLPHGRPTSRISGRVGYRTDALVQLVGEAFFTLLEALSREDFSIKPHDRVYIGRNSRVKITYIVGRVSFNELTATAKMELPLILSKIVLIRSKRFLSFFNTARAITPRMHALELLPGIGKKYMWQVINERDRGPFKSFDDLKNRTDLPDPIRLITKRILEELSSDSKYRVFTRTE